MEHRVSNSQLEELINYLMEHQSLAKGVGLGPRSKETIDRQWEGLATKLNAHGLGATKSGQRWKRYWADLKHKVKARASAQRRDASCTGGGPAQKDDLSDNDKKVLAIIGDGAAYGDTQHKVPAFLTPISTSNTQPQPEMQEFGTDCAEVVVATESSLLPPPASELFTGQTPISPSIRGNTGTFYTLQAPPTSAGPDRSQGSQLPRLNTDSPVSRRRSRSSIRSRNILGHRFGESWVVELEQRRVDAESKLADAAVITAAAARTQAEAARLQVEASLSVAQALHEQTVMLNKLFDILSKK